MNNTTMLESRNALTILFDWKNLSFEDLKFLCQDLDKRNIRWLARNHPDNRTRENLFRLSNVQVGEKTVINSGLFIYCYEPRVIIGSYCALAANISLITDSNPNMSELNDIPFVKEHYIKSDNITIEDHVWIGANAIIFPGITVGHHSIVGAGTILTKSVPPYSVVKGQPGTISRTLNQI